MPPRHPSRDVIPVITRGAVSAIRRLPSLSGMQTSTVTQPLAPTGLRSVERVHRSTGFHWVGNGFHVSTYFPSDDLSPERTSPFVLMDYGPAKQFPPLARGKRGVGWHPHRGFETV